MGTRNLVCVALDGELKVAQYGQWDGYLDVRCRDILTFIKKQMRLDKFKTALRECRFVSKAVIQKTWKDCGADDSGMVTMDVSDKHARLYPAFSRDTGSDILTLIQDGTFAKNVRDDKAGTYGRKKFKVTPVRELDDQRSFASDSVWCEWAYVLDLDTETLEIYQGFNFDTPKGRFAKLKPTGGKSITKANKGKQYQTITLWRTLTFDECRAPRALQKLKKQYKEENKED